MKIIGKTLLFIVLFIFATELFVRLQINFFSNSLEREDETFLRELQTRVYRHWQNPEPKDPFLPPFRVFADRDWDNADRLHKIASSVHIRPGQYESYDFLQDERYRDETRYRIAVNSLGFRGAERAKIKSSSTFRIIVLGDYHAFGHGVDDDKTYSSVLESELNSRLGKKSHRRFEVWNGGRDAGTAIVGLARLQNEILEESPDALIIDYGFVDSLVWGDDAMTASMYFPERLRSFARWVTPYLEMSQIFFRFQSRMFLTSFALKRSAFEETLSRISDIAAKRNLPIIFVRELESRFPLASYSRFQSSNVSILNVAQLFEAHPPAPSLLLHPEITWVRDLSPPARLMPDYQFWPYRLDLFQLSPEGHRVIAEELFERTAAIVK
jgi:hypothetical protein